MREQAREHQAHEEREAEQERHARGAVLGLLDGEDEAEGDREEEDEADRRDASAMNRLKPVATPIHAPRTVGTMESASSQ